MNREKFAYNPYDFGNPVSDERLFSGRNKELKEIDYYLQQAATAPRATNIALMGERASGKTSLLNMIEKKAQEKGLCTVRIDLNEGDVQQEIFFFFKVLDAVLNAVMRFKHPDGTGFCFGGIKGRTFECYLDMTSSYTIPEDKTYCPFIFPVVYAKAMANNVLATKVSDAQLKADLTLAQKEAGKPIVVLFDECNVLTAHRVLLEMLRNIFMNLPGFMLVFSGTEQLFPVMDDVFSPIVRQFKKIKVESFETLQETEDCIGKPLVALGFSEWRKLFHLSTLSELQQIHQLTGGRPYEIQLLCHFMFKRLQLGEVTKMELKLEVLDDVLLELTSGQDIHARNVISKVKALGKEGVRALSKLTLGNGQMTFAQLYGYEYLLHGSKRYSETRLKSHLDDFVASGILSDVGGVIRFLGDELDKIYLKYFARQTLKISLLFPTSPMTELLSDEISRFCQVRGNLRPLNFFVYFDVIYDSGLLGAFLDGRLYPPADDMGVGADFPTMMDQLRSVTKKKDIFKEKPVQARTLYWLAFELAQPTNIISRIRNIRVQYENDEINMFFLEMRAKKRAFKHSFEGDFEMLASRGQKYGFTLTAGVCDTPVIISESVVKGLNKSSNRNLRQDIGESHATAVITNYLRNPRNIDLAKIHASFFGDLEIESDSMTLNNVGYLWLVAGELLKAEKYLTLAAAHPATSGAEALPHYNLGILSLKKHNLVKSAESFRASILASKNHPLKDYEEVTILIPKFRRSSMTMDEADNVNLLSCAEEALKLVKEVQMKANS